MSNDVDATPEKDGWVKLAKCKYCGRPPLVVPVSKTVTVIGCTHGEPVDYITEGFGRPEDWNNAQKD